MSWLEDAFGDEEEVGMGGVQFKRPDGGFSSASVDRHTVSPYDVVQAALRVSSRISPRYFVATAKVESNYTVNERDPHDQGDKSASDGIFQISRAEAISSGHPLADLFDLNEAATVLAVLAHRRLSWIESRFPSADPGQLRAYLTVGHNQGTGAMRKTLEKYGLDWERYRLGNAAAHPEWIRYGDYAISGGPNWQLAWDDLAPSGGGAVDPMPIVGLVAAVGLAYLIGERL